jgi:ribonuclease VapC
MVIDTSALIAILEDEPERSAFVRMIVAADSRLVSAATVLEAGIVMESRRGEHAGRELDLLLHRAKVEIVPVDAEQVEVARAACRRYGRGHHAPGLNFGDCFAYALAKLRGEALLFKGNDFAATDIGTPEFPQFPVATDAPAITLSQTLDT